MLLRKTVPNLICLDTCHITQGGKLEYARELRESNKLINTDVSNDISENLNMRRSVILRQA